MATTLTDLVNSLTTCAYTVSGDLTLIPSEVAPLNDQINPQGSNAVSKLIQQDSSAIDFSGLGAQAFQESLKVHLDVTGQLVDAFNGASKALYALGDTVTSLNSQYDGRLSTIKGSDYAPGYPYNNITEGARQAFYDLHPATAMIDDVISAADGNSVLTDGASNLLGLLNSAYTRLLNRAYSEHISIAPTPGDTKLTPAQETNQQMQAQTMVVDALANMCNDIYQAYSNWGSGVHQAFTTFTSAMNMVEQTVKPYTDLLTQPTSAASIFDLIHMISGSDEPIAIVQTGPNSILVVISGTNASKSAAGYDTNIWNALMTGMGQNSPYEQDVIEAIQQYCQEHGLTNPQVTLAGHSLGGMVAQQVADQGLFNVTQVVTYGSPAMGDPFPGIKYDLYEAQGDPVPLLSRYENPTLPSSYQELAQLYPYVPLNYEGFKNPFSHWGLGLIQDIGSAGHDAYVAGEDVTSIIQNLGGAGYLYFEASLMANFVPLKVGPVPVGSIINDINGNSAGNLSELDPNAKRAFMDHNGLYGNSIKLVPDLTDMSPGVHSEYGQSQWLENTQPIFQAPNLPSGNILDHIEYFGMPNEYQTATINQYMDTHSSLGQILSKVNGY